jgi:hypothetical protein
MVFMVTCSGFFIPVSRAGGLNTNRDRLFDWLETALRSKVGKDIVRG